MRESPAVKKLYEVSIKYFSVYEVDSKINMNLMLSKV
jgi:hypothetical protein